MDLHVLDFLNSVFEWTASLMIWVNVNKIWKDKKINGVSLLATMYFTALGSFNIFYYYELNQMISLSAGIFVALGDVIYLWLFLKYKNNK